MAKRRNRKNACGLSAADWIKLFRAAGIETEQLDAAKSSHARATLIGNFLARHVGRAVPIEVGEQTGTARLQVTKSRGNKKQYYFEIEWASCDVESRNATNQPADEGREHDQVRQRRRSKGRQEESNHESKPAGGNAGEADRSGAGNTECW